MTHSIPQELLQKASHILFVAPLTVQDVAYAQAYFNAFAAQYPHIAIDLWVDEKQQALYDWLATVHIINKVYRAATTASVYKELVREVQRKQYPLVVVLAPNRVDRYVALARTLVPHGMVVAPQKSLRWFNIVKKKRMKKADVLVKHAALIGVSDFYDALFEQLFGVQVEQRKPVVTIPKEWVLAATLKFMKHGINKKQNPFGKVFFINGYSQHKNLSWSVESIVALIKKLKQNDAYGDVTFLVNVPPERYDALCDCLVEHIPNNVIVFSARENFFQLPATLALCDKVVSVESDVVHLAHAVGVPVVVLGVDQDATAL